MQLRFHAACAVAVALAALAPGANRYFFGPPLLCFPLDIGDAVSIPDPSGPEPRAAALEKPAEFLRRVLAVLDGTNDTLVHIETMRRASITIHGLNHDSDKGRAVVAEIELRFVDRALRATLQNPGDALAWLDAGYLLEAIRTGSTSNGLSGMEYLEKAASIAPKDASIPLAQAGAAFMQDTSLFGKGGTEICRKYYETALCNAPEESRVRKNVIASMTYFLGSEAAEKIIKAAK
jgi:tetratricopeptide (TPR) repeat protein